MAKTDENGIFVAEETDKISPLHSYINAMMGSVSSALTGIIPTGVVVPYAGTQMVDGWIMCDGRVTNRSENPDLFRVIGTTFGKGDGSSGSFNVPDLRVRFPLGVDRFKTAYDTPGKTGGAERVTLTINQMPAHDHTGKTGGGRAEEIRLAHKAGGRYSNKMATGFDTGPSGPTIKGSNKSPGLNHWHQIRMQGKGQSHENMPPYLTLNYIIKR